MITELKKLSSAKTTFKGYYAHKKCLDRESEILLMGPGENKEAYIKNSEKKLAENGCGDLPF